MAPAALVDVGFPPRNEVPGSVYHVIARGVERRRIFVDDEDYMTYVRLLAAIVERQGWHLLCFCLMPNHVHLMIETPEPNLGAGVQWLHSRYALAFNRRHDRIGHLFAGRYKSPVVASDGGFVKLVGYIVMNPVAAKLCRRPADWPWGSHAVRSNGSAPSWLADARLTEWLEEVTASRCYDELILTCERAA